jgi:hypothetical protein
MSTSQLTETQTKLNYQVVTSKCKSHGAEGSTVYGVKIVCSGDVDDFAEIDDISTDKREVELLIFKLNHGQVTPDQLKYIIEDYLVELSTI